MNLLKGYRSRIEAQTKQEFILVRKLMYASLLPYLIKGSDEASIWSFDWEQNALEKVKEKDVQSMQDELQKVKNFWAEMDKKRNKNN